MDTSAYAYRGALNASRSEDLIVQYPDVVVIGGGIAGFACATGLADAGFRVQLFESADEYGGRACSFDDAVTGERVDIGPHVITSEHRNMLALLGRLGTRNEIIWQPEKFITLIDAGRPVDMRNHRLPAPLHFLPNFFGVDALSFADVWSARRLLWLAMRLNEADVLRYDPVPAADLLRECGVSTRFTDWFWRTVCTAIMNVPLEQCSAGSLLRFMKMMAGRGDFHFGFPAVPLADLYVPGATALIEKAGGNVRKAAPVRRILVEDDAVRGVEMADGAIVPATRCVAAVPPAALVRLLPDGLRARHEVFRTLDGFEPSPYISTYLWFSRRLTREKFWARIWSPRDVNCDFYDLANIRRQRHDEGSLIATNSIFSHAVSGQDDAEIVAATLRELREFLPQVEEADLRHARVHRIPMAIPAPRPGFERLRPDVRTPVNGLFLAGDWIQTALPASMESAARAGYLAAEALTADSGRTLKLAVYLRPMRGIAGWFWRRRNTSTRKPAAWTTDK